MAYKIYLSPSNQSGNAYTTGGTNEMVQCDKIAKAAATALRRCGFSVMIGKSGDSMANRCRESDVFGADIHMPIHTNAYNYKVTGGTLVMVCRNTTKHNKAGNALLKAVGSISPGADYALSHRSDLYELTAPNAMSLYLEVEFHDTKTGSDWIRTHTTDIGEAIAKGMCEYFDIKYKKATITSGAKKNKVEKVRVTMQKIYRNNNSNEKGQVRTLQRILNGANNGEGYRGVEGERLSVDGNFGKNTEYALNTYKKKYGLKANGVCDQETWDKLLCAVK